VGNRSIVAMRAAFVAVAASRALVTSAYNVATHTLPQDRCYRSKDKRE
jgi:hypothetical protein